MNYLCELASYYYYCFFIHNSIEEEKDETKRVRQSNEIYFLKSLFSNFDHDGDGFLSLEELRRY